MIKKIGLTLGAAVTLLWAATPAISHEGEGHEASEKKQGPKEHSHKAPHGGMVVTVEKYHYEMVVEEKAAHIYLLDEQEKTLPISGITGSAVFQIPKKGNKTVTLSPSGDHFTAVMDLKGVEKFVAVVSLKIEGKSRVGGSPTRSRRRSTLRRSTPKRAGTRKGDIPTETRLSDLRQTKHNGMRYPLPRQVVIAGFNFFRISHYASTEGSVVDERLEMVW